MAANLRFLRGTYANLLNQPKVDGNIYITTDEPGLYVDYGTNRLRIGDYRIFPSLDALKAHYRDAGVSPSTTCLYYLTNDNILACYDGTNFKQINSQKSLMDLIHSFSATVTTANDKVTVAHTISADATNTNTKSSAFTIESGNKNALKVSGSNGAITVTAKDTSTVAKINTSADNKVTLTSTLSGKDANGADITPVKTTSSVEFVGTGITVSSTEGETGKITITNNDKLSAQAQMSGNNAKLITTLRRNDDSNNTSSVSFTPIITYGNSAKSAATVAIDATDKTKVTFDLDVYSKTQIDTLINKKLTAVNAMRFVNKVSSEDDLPELADKVRVGDTYIVSAGNAGASFTVSLDGSTTTQVITAQSGDLLIAAGKENEGTATSEGYITENLVWVYVPSADDTMTLTMSAVGSDGVLLQSQQGAAEASTVFQLLSDDILSIAWDGASNKKSATFSHVKKFADSSALTTAQTGSEDTSAADQTLDGTVQHLVTGLTFDAWGHVTGYTWRDVTINNFRITEIQNSIQAGTVISDYAKGDADASTSIVTTLSTNDTTNPTMSSKFTIKADKNSAIAIKSDNTAKNPSVTIGMVWVDF